MLAALSALGSMSGEAGGQGSMDTSSSAISGNAIGGINLGNQSNIRNMPDWLAGRISTKPQAISPLSDPLNIALLGGLLVVGVLIIKKVL